MIIRFELGLEEWGGCISRTRSGDSNTGQPQAWAKRGNEVEIKVKFEILNWTGLLIIKSDQEVMESAQDVIKKTGRVARAQLEAEIKAK